MPDQPWPARSYCVWESQVVQAKEQERQERLTMMAKALRSSMRVPTDTYITDDIPTLLTRLGQVPPVPERERP